MVSRTSPEPLRNRALGLLLGCWGLTAGFATLPAIAAPILPAQPNRTISELFSLVVANTATETNAAPGGPYTNTYIFNYANRTAFTNDGWNFLATSPGGAVRNTETTSGLVVSYDQVGHPGVLRIPCDIGDLWASGANANNSRNSIFRSLPSNWTTMQVAVAFAPAANYQQVHLALYQDDDNYVQAGLAWNSDLNPNNGQVITLIWEYGGYPNHYFTPWSGVANIWLRLDRDLVTGNVTQLWSQNGISWNVLGTTSQALVNPRLCIWAGSGPNPAGPANCDLQRLDVVAASGAPVLFTYQLLNPPAGAAIDANGVITWTPSETQGPATYTLTTVATDNQVPRASSTNSFQVTVTDLGPPWPVLPAIPSQTINELTTLLVTNTGSESPYVKQGVTNTFLFNYPDRASLLADGWSYVGTTANGGARDTEQTSGPVASYDQVGHPGILRIPCDVGDLWGPGGNTRNSLFRNLPTNWLSLQVSFSFPAIVNVDQTHMALYQNDDNYLQVGVAYNSYSGGRGVTMDIETAGTVTTLPRVPTSATNIWLRLDRKTTGGPVAGFFSGDGINWTVLGTNTPGFANPRLAIWTGSYNVPYGAGSPSLDLKRVDITSISNVPTVLNYSLVNPPDGASISSDGVVTWTPSELQGPGAATITTIATDNNAPPLKATNSFLVVVNEVNTPPVLPIQPDLRVAGITPIIVTNTATDSDIPINSLSYSLASGPVGAAIEANGVITWIPAQTQVPSTNLFVTVVTDSNPWAANSQSLSATNSFTVIVDAIHNGPSLPALMDVSAPELTLLRVTNTASYSDVPASTLVYRLINPPTGASINTNGVITWLPSEAQGPGTFVFITTVTDNGVPPLSATNYFIVFVDEINSPPTLPVQPNVEISGTSPLWVTNTASDADIPKNTLSYQFSSAPVGASIDTNGVISWTPSAAQVPSTNVFVTVVTDDNPSAVNDQHLSATNSFTVVVKPVRNGPALPALADVSIPDSMTLRVTNTATYTDLPPTTLAYALLAPPAGAVIDSNGVITWTPADGQQATTNVITTVVADAGVPPLSATNSFTVVVLPLPAPFHIVSLSLSNNLAWVIWEAEAGQTYRLQFKDDLSQANWQDVLPDVTATGSTASTSHALGDAAIRFYRIQVRP
jgi:hypothetical protein